MREKIILLDSLRSLQNVGAIFRNADGAWFTKLILCGHTPTPPRSDIAKTALWAEKTIDWEYFENAEEILLSLKKEGFAIFALETGENAKDFREYQNKNFEKVCIVVGNEVKGVDEKILSICDEIVMIPMLGKKSSLNVSVAAGVIMYTFL